MLEIIFYKSIAETKIAHVANFFKQLCLNEADNDDEMLSCFAFFALK